MTKYSKVVLRGTIQKGCDEHLFIRYKGGVDRELDDELGEFTGRKVEITVKNMDVERTGSPDEKGDQEGRSRRRAR